MSETEKRVFVVTFSRDAMVVKSARVRKETPQFYMIDADKSDRYAFGYSSRVEKDRFATTERDALQRYINKRTNDKNNAAAVVEQATEQIAQAEALMAIPEPVQA